MSLIQSLWDSTEVDADGERLGTALGELVLELGDETELGRADGGEVGWMRKEDHPVASGPLVKAYRAFRRVSFEIRGGGS